MKTWYYIDPSNQHAQALDTELPHLIAEDQITPKTLVWSEGMDEWGPASVELAFYFGSDLQQTAGSPPHLYLQGLSHKPAMKSITKSLAMICRSSK